MAGAGGQAGAGASRSPAAGCGERVRARAVRRGATLLRPLAEQAPGWPPCGAARADPTTGSAVEGRRRGARGVPPADRLHRAAPGPGRLLPGAAAMGAGRRALGGAARGVAVGRPRDRGSDRRSPAPWPTGATSPAASRLLEQARTQPKRPSRTTSGWPTPSPICTSARATSPRPRAVQLGRRPGPGLRRRRRSGPRRLPVARTTATEWRRRRSKRDRLHTKFGSRLTSWRSAESCHCPCVG